MSHSKTLSRLTRIAVGVLFVLSGTARCPAQSTYPTVYGSTGHPYGPTQAAYQYQRQYGRPWHGYGGQVSPGSFGGTYVVPGMLGSSNCGQQHVATWGAPVVVSAPFGFGYSAPGPYIYGLEQLTNPGSYIPRVATLTDGTPHRVISVSVAPDLADGLGPLVQSDKKLDPSQRPVVATSTAAKLKSIEKQAFGDEQLRKQQWAKAYLEYRAAVDTAPDRADAHYRFGFLLVAMSHHASAVREFKRAVFLDPTLPQTGDRMATVFGPESQVVRTSLIHKVADWLREDIRDPDRLFLFGVLLHFENDARSRDVLEAAQRMATSTDRFADHITAFLPPSVELPEIAGPKPDPELFDLPNLLPPPPLPARDASPVTLPPLSNQATPPEISPRS